MCETNLGQIWGVLWSEMQPCGAPRCPGTGLRRLLIRLVALLCFSKLVLPSFVLFFHTSTLMKVSVWSPYWCLLIKVIMMLFVWKKMWQGGLLIESVTRSSLTRWRLTGQHLVYSDDFAHLGKLLSSPAFLTFLPRLSHLMCYRLIFLSQK